MPKNRERIRYVHRFRNNRCGKYERNDVTLVRVCVSVSAIFNDTRLIIVCTCVYTRARARALHTLHNAPAHDNKHSDWERQRGRKVVKANTKIHRINWTDTMNGSREPRSFRSKMVERVRESKKHKHTRYVYNIYFYLLLNLLFLCWILLYKYNVVLFSRFSTIFSRLLRLFVCFLFFFFHYYYYSCEISCVYFNFWV